MAMSFDQYMRDMIQPMRDELTTLGIRELRTPEEVEENLPNATGTTLVVICRTRQRSDGASSRIFRAVPTVFAFDRIVQRRRIGTFYRASFD